MAADVWEKIGISYEEWANDEVFYRLYMDEVESALKTFDVGLAGACDAVRECLEENY